MWEFDLLSAFVVCLSIGLELLLFWCFEEYYCRKAKHVCADCKAWSCRGKICYYKKKKAGD